MKIMLVVDIQQVRKDCSHCRYIVYLASFPFLTKLLRCIILAFFGPAFPPFKQGRS